MSKDWIKKQKFIKISKEKVTKSKMPKYNGFSCGYGVHGDVKYNRRFNKAQLQDLLDEYNDNVENERCDDNEYGL